MNECESKSGRHFAHGGQTLLRAGQTRLRTHGLYDRLSRIVDALPMFARPFADQSRKRKLNYLPQPADPPDKKTSRFGLERCV